MSTSVPSGVYLASSLIETNCEDISFSKREARNFATYDGEVMNTQRFASTPICH